jgi:predicted nicotinamide N-methyase
MAHAIGVATEVLFAALAFGFGAVVAAAAGADAALADGAGVASAAQAGTTVKANNSNRYFIFSLLIFSLTINADFFTAQRRPYPMTAEPALFLQCD